MVIPGCRRNTGSAGSPRSRSARTAPARRRRPPGGESFADTACRVNRACERILRDHPGQTVLVISHITPIKIMLCRALGVPLLTMYRLYLGSACISEIQWHGAGFAAVRCVNDTSHLSGQQPRPLAATREER